jgi:DNA-directed RNA polymerase subunit RPC12/RpoP
MTPDTNANVPTGATQLIDVLDFAEAAGFVAEFEVATDSADHGALRCPHCGSENSAVSFERTWSRRLEGASDPADMLHVSALRCPNCATRGVFITPFGPTASERQSSVLHALPPAGSASPPVPQ